MARPLVESSWWRPDNRTSFGSMSLGYQLTPSLSLVGMASFGRTSPMRDRLGRYMGAHSHAAAFSLGLSAENLLGRGDRAGIALIAPTHAVGFANVDGSPGLPHGLAVGARYQFEF